MFKKIISICLMMSIIPISFPVRSEAQELTSVSKIQNLAHIIEWRYKEINGRWYKRQYDCTAQKWLGSWTPC